MAELGGHGGTQNEVNVVPRLVEALAGMKVIGASAGSSHTAVWTGAGELFTLGKETMGSWAMATEGHRVSLCQGWWWRWQGAAVGHSHSSVRRGRGALYLWDWQLGH